MRKGSINTYAGLFLISVSTLLLELMQMRILSIVVFPGLVYIVITFALLGFGISGALLAVSSALRKATYHPFLFKLCLLYSLSIFVGVFHAGRFPAATFFHLLRQPVYLFVLLANGILFAAPFIFVGLCLGRILMEPGARINALYCVNLVGSGVGCALYPLAVRVFGGPGAIVCAAALGLLAGAFFIRHRGTARFGLAVAISCALIAIGPSMGGRVLKINAGADKELSGFQDKKRYPDAEVEWSFWTPLCRTDIVGSTHYAATVPDGSTVPRKAVTIDGAARTFMWGRMTPAQKEACRKDYEFMRSFRMLAYLTKRRPDVLLIGVGGGNDVVNAELQGANSITGVDINEGVVRAMKGPYRSFTGGLYTDGPANILVSEGRSFVRQVDQKFDIIHMHGVDTFAALSSGAHVFSENYLYTVEAFEDYLNHLNDGGILSTTRLSLFPPRETLRLFSVALDALERLGTPHPFRNIIILGDPYTGRWATLLCKRSAFTAEEIAQYEELCRRVPYFVYWIPNSNLTQSGLRDGRTNFYYRFYTHVREGRRRDFVREYTYSVTSTTDDRPFFYKSWRFRDIFRPSKSSAGTWGPFGSWGLLALLTLTAEAIVGIVALIFLPLFRFRKDGLKVKGAGSYAAYFCCLGLGFMLIEVPLMQRLSLFLGHPSYSISVVLFCLLVFCGIGSLVSGKIAIAPARVITLSVLVLSGMLFLLNFGVFTPVTRYCLGLPLGIRVIITVVLVAPLAFLMGMPFPSGLRIVRGNEASQFIPWAWGVNGAASVLGSVGSIVLAMFIGFSALMSLAALIYLLGMLVLVWRTSLRAELVLSNP